MAAPYIIIQQAEEKIIKHMNIEERESSVEQFPLQSNCLQDVKCPQKQWYSYE